MCARPDGLAWLCFGKQGSPRWLDHAGTVPPGHRLLGHPHSVGCLPGLLGRQNHTGFGGLKVFLGTV